MKSNGPLTEPCGVPQGSGKESEVTLSMTKESEVTLSMTTAKQ